MTNVFAITVADPGPQARLGAAARRELRTAVRDAGRSDAGAVLMTVAADAWAQDPFHASDGLSADDIGREFHTLLLALFGLDRPVVVHLGGRATGLGLGLLLAADVRFAAAQATVDAGDAGQGLSGGLAWLLTHRVGSAVAARLAWGGAALTAEQAFGRGIIDQVADDPGVAAAEAERLAALPRSAASAIKRSLNGRLRGEFQAQLNYDSWLTTVAVGATG